MARLQHKEAMRILYEAMESGKYYWRTQRSAYNGTIPAGHKSHERMYGTEFPQHIEEGVSCFGNPFQLERYLSDEANDLDETDVVLFVGNYVGEGIDEEDIVQVEEAAVKYYTSLRNFYKFVMENGDYVEYDRFGTEFKFRNKKEDYSPEFLEILYEL